MKKVIKKITDAILKPKTEISMTEDEFYEKYNPVKNHLDDNAAFDGCMFETYGKEHDHILTLAQDPQKKNKVWTILETEGNLYFVNDYHYVNRLGYLVTEEQFPEGINIEVKLDNVEDSRISTAKFVKEITVIDPDTNGEVEIEIYKHENGGMFAIDSSFLDQCINTDNYDRPIIPDPFSDNDVEEGTISHVVLFD